MGSISSSADRVGFVYGQCCSVGLSGMTHLYCPTQQLPATSAALETAHAAEELGFRLCLHLRKYNSLKGTCGKCLPL